MNTPRRTDGIDLGEIFRKYGPAYRDSHKLPLKSLKAMSAIENCRTEELGGHVYQCDNCGDEKIAYNSCRNRHCPKCQSMAKEKWLSARKEELLPVPYFHAVLTIPDTLNPVALVNQKIIYNILFRAGKETFLELGRDPKHLGAEIGFIAVLHTWGQILLDHPHLHCIIPCGGLTEDGKQWLLPKKHRRGKDFFVHVNVISDLFKKKFLSYFDTAYKAGELKFVGKTEYLNDKQAYKKFKNELYKSTWVSYCKKPFGGPEKVLEYLGRYTHRVAISNHRIVKVENDKVTFTYRDYKDDNKKKHMTLEVFEFIRRFLLHVLPQRFVKIRYYGLLNNRMKKENLKLCRKILDVPESQNKQKPKTEGWEELLLRLTGVDPAICSNCGKGKMVRRRIVRHPSYRLLT
ncbi:MAG: IS91 family transposase [Candidatus Scalindua sp.]